MERTHQNYFGLTKPSLYDVNTGLTIENPFICISEIILYDWRLQWTYDVFVSTEHFDSGGKPITDFRREFWLDTDQFNQFKNSNQVLFELLDERFRALVKPTPSESALFELAHFKTLEYQLTIFYSDGDDSPARKLKNDSYHLNIAQNLDVIGFDTQNTPGLIPILHSIATSKDLEFFAETTLILP